MRWWDGVGWTEHVALPEPEPEETEVVYLDVAKAPVAVKVDDGELHPRAKDVAFEGAPRGPVDPPGTRLRIDRDSLLSLQGAQLMGAVAFTIMCWAIAVRGFMDPGGQWTGVKVGIAICLGMLVPIAIRVVRRIQARNEFWLFWSASRGFEPGVAEGPGKIMPGLLSRSPLLGPTDGRIFEYVSRRRMVGREAIVGTLLRVLDVDPELDPDDARYATRDTVRVAFALLPMPEPAANRWKGASIRADHQAMRPLVLRSMVGPLCPSSVPDCRAHLAVAPGQDPGRLYYFFEARLERYVAEHPMDVDIVDNLLVVTREGDPFTEDLLDDLARDALLLHELLVPEQEVPQVAAPAQVAMPVEDEPTIDRTREGWGGGDAQQYDAA